MSSHQKERENIFNLLTTSLGFTQNYINRAFKIYEKNWGTMYDIEVITEIIKILQTKDKKKKSKTQKIKKESRKQTNLFNTSPSISSSKSSNLNNPDINHQQIDLSDINAINHSDIINVGEPSIIGNESEYQWNSDEFDDPQHIEPNNKLTTNNNQNNNQNDNRFGFKIQYNQQIANRIRKRITCKFGNSCKYNLNGQRCRYFHENNQNMTNTVNYHYYETTQTKEFDNVSEATPPPTSIRLDINTRNGDNNKWNKHNEEKQRLIDKYLKLEIENNKLIAINLKYEQQINELKIKRNEKEGKKEKAIDRNQYKLLEELNDLNDRNNELINIKLQNEKEISQLQEMKNKSKSVIQKCHQIITNKNNEMEILNQKLNQSQQYCVDLTKTKKKQKNENNKNKNIIITLQNNTIKHTIMINRLLIGIFIIVLTFSIYNYF